MKKIWILAGIISFPSFAYAQGNGLMGIINGFKGIVSNLIPVVFGFAVVLFFWGLAKYIGASGSEEGKAEGKRIMVGGVIALFIMSSIWGIVTFIRDDLGIKEIDSMTVPTFGR